MVGDARFVEGTAAMTLLQSTDAARAWLTYREYERVRVLGRGQHGSAVLLRHAVTGECVVSKEVRTRHSSPLLARHAMTCHATSRRTAPHHAMSKEVRGAHEQRMVLCALCAHCVCAACTLHARCMRASHAIQVLTDGMDVEELDKVTTEVLILSTLKHGNITGFYGSFQRDEKLSIVMEYASSQ